VHGDYHVGQILRSPAGYQVIDFEGEPTRPLEERRELDSPLRDVASMLRSIDHVPLWVLRDDESTQSAELIGEWASACRAAFLEGYEDALLELPNTSTDRLDRSLLRAFEAEKAAYEFAYAESFLPEWLPIAAAGAELLLSREAEA
jgi:maltokinase